jgi:DNA-binding IclR family transcriptional regulator
MGLQTLDRAVGALKVLGAVGEEGMRLVDLQQALGLTKPTAHRLLAALAGHGLVELDPVGRRYRLGQELAILGRSASGGLQELGRLLGQSASVLAEETGDTVFVCARSGFEAVCIDRRTGAYPIKVLTVEVGTRRPLGVGAGGLAILAALPSAESTGIVETVAERLAEHGRASAGQVRHAVREARRIGYSVSRGFVSDCVRAVGVAVRDRAGQPVASLGVAAITSRITDARIESLGKALLRERGRIESRLKSSLPSRRGATGMS